MRILSTLAIAAAFGMAAIGTDAKAASYAAGVWGTDDIVLLDDNYNEVSRFDAGATNPNGMAFGDNLIFSGHFGTQEVVAYDLAGTEQFRWSGSFGNLQGMTYLNSQIVIANAGSLLFYNALTGVQQATVAYGGGSGVEGLTTDGTNIYALNSGAIQVYDTAGNLLDSFANAASGCSFGGTGITFAGVNTLALMCTNGNWFEVSATDGSVLDSGNNGLDAFGLTAVSPIPLPPAFLLLLAGFGTMVLIRRPMASA